MGMLDDRTHIDLYPGGLSRQFVPFAQPNSHFPDQEGVNPGIAMMLKDAGIDPEKFEGTAKDTRAALAFAKRGRAARLGLDYNKRSEEHTSELQSLMRISYAVFCLKQKHNTPQLIRTVIKSYNQQVIH